MSKFKGNMVYFYKEINKLIRSTNFLKWMKRIDLPLIEHEVMEYVLGETFEPSEDKTQKIIEYKKGEVMT